MSEPAILIGIHNGPYSRLFDLEDNPTIGWLWRPHPQECLLFPEGRDGAVLEIEGYEEGMPKESRPVIITLRRRGYEQVILQLHANNFDLVGPPTLVWSATS